MLRISFMFYSFKLCHDQLNTPTSHQNVWQNNMLLILPLISRRVYQTCEIETQDLKNNHWKTF